MKRHYQLSLVTLLLLLLAACASNPFKTAKTIEQQGDALYGSYVIAKEQGAAILKDVTIPDMAKRPVAQAMVASKESGDALQDSLIEYSSVKAQLDAGKTSDDKLLIAEQNISAWLAKADPVIRRLIDSVRGVLK